MSSVSKQSLEHEMYNYCWPAALRASAVSGMCWKLVWHLRRNLLCLYFWWSWSIRAVFSSSSELCWISMCTGGKPPPLLSSSCDTCSFFCDVMAHLMSAEVQEELLWWKWPTGIPRQIPPGRWWWGWTPQLLPAQSNPALWRTPRALQAALLRSGQFLFF